jgi:hypothetical protein
LCTAAYDLFMQATFSPVHERRFSIKISTLFICGVLLRRNIISILLLFLPHMHDAEGAQPHTEGMLPLTHFPVAICTQTDADTEYTAASFMPSPSDYIKICTRRGKYVFIHRASTRRIAQRVSHLLTSHAARRASQIDDDNNRKN